eukprot:TRINITY_DN18118_c0_g4_i1.p1 TRINITY_DN18118_c0_g4~~TRINITY_DN18118_c0_g4_i1.p1  ORF type:complete len:754 (-),score=176.99 TRINITY_DN18118_c0_g4_i1:158-2419(-)
MSSDQAMLAEKSEKSSADLVNCQFTVNEQVLKQTVKSLFAEMVREYGLEDLVHGCEVAHLKDTLHTKADAGGLKVLTADVAEQKQQIQQKASQATVAATQAQLRGIESTVGWKADQTAVDEITAKHEILASAVSAKVNLSDFNRISATANKLSQQVLQQDKMIQDLAGRLQKLEMHNLPSTAARMADQSKFMKAQLKQVQEDIARKAESSAVEEMMLSLRELDSNCSIKAGPGQIQELKSAIRDLQLKIDLKADTPSVEEQRAELSRVSQQVLTKADQQDLREVGAGLNTLRSDIDSKAAGHVTGDLRTRIQALESCLESKASTKELAELVSLREGLAQKADRRLVNELSSSVDRFQREATIKAEMAARNMSRRESEARDERLDQLELSLQNVLQVLAATREETAETGESTCLPSLAAPIEDKVLSSKMEQLDSRLQSVLELMELKANRADVEDFLKDKLSAATENAVENQTTAEAMANETLQAMANETLQRCNQETRAMGLKIEELDSRIQSALDSLKSKADKSDIEEMLTTAASSAMSEINKQPLPSEGITTWSRHSTGNESSRPCSKTRVNDGTYSDSSLFAAAKARVAAAKAASESEENRSSVDARLDAVARSTAAAMMQVAGGSVASISDALGTAADAENSAEEAGSADAGAPAVAETTDLPTDGESVSESLLLPAPGPEESSTVSKDMSSQQVEAEVRGRGIQRAKSREKSLGGSSASSSTRTPATRAGAAVYPAKGYRLAASGWKA